MYCNTRCSGIIQFRWAILIFTSQTKLEHARKPPNESGLLVSTLRALKSYPLLHQHLHPARLLHPQDALAQLLSVGGPWEFLCWGWQWEWLSSTTTTTTTNPTNTTTINTTSITWGQSKAIAAWPEHFAHLSQTAVTCNLEK